MNTGKCYKPGPVLMRTQRDCCCYHELVRDGWFTAEDRVTNQRAGFLGFPPGPWRTERRLSSQTKDLALQKTAPALDSKPLWGSCHVGAGGIQCSFPLGSDCPVHLIKDLCDHRVQLKCFPVSTSSRWKRQPPALRAIARHVRAGVASLMSSWHNACALILGPLLG
jgi:hypothetical protein